jgi:hypothetical protein
MSAYLSGLADAATVRRVESVFELTLDCALGIGKELPMLVLCPPVTELLRLEASVVCCGVCALILRIDERLARSICRCSVDVAAHQKRCSLKNEITWERKQFPCWRGESECSRQPNPSPEGRSRSLQILPSEMIEGGSGLRGV